MEAWQTTLISHNFYATLAERTNGEVSLSQPRGTRELYLELTYEHEHPEELALKSEAEKLLVQSGGVKCRQSDFYDLQGARLGVNATIEGRVASVSVIQVGPARK